MKPHAKISDLVDCNQCRSVAYIAKSAHLRRHFKKLLKTPGLHNKEIAEKFINLIDEAFRQYKAFQQSHTILDFGFWILD